MHDARRALEFYAKAFGAKEVSERIPYEGKIGHAELEIEGALVMLADEFPAYNKSPKTLGGTPVIIHIDVEDVNSFFARAVDAGAKVLQPIKDEPWGRICKLEDPFGHTGFSTHHILRVGLEIRTRASVQLRKLCESDLFIRP